MSMMCIILSRMATATLSLSLSIFQASSASIKIFRSALGSRRGKQVSSQQSGGGSYSGTGPKADLDNHGNQWNPNNQNYKGYSSSYSGTGKKPDLDNHSNQMNPNNPQYQGSKK